MVFHRLNYSDTSVILKVYTEKLGLRSYLLRGARSGKGGRKVALFSPLAMLEMVVYERASRELQHLREVKLERPYQHIPFEESRHALLLFLNEVLYRSIREEEPNPLLFSYIHEQLLRLDDPEVGLGSFHLVFLLDLSRYLGFGPDAGHDEAHPCFSLQEGRFRAYGIADDSLLEPLPSAWLARIMQEGERFHCPDPGMRRLLLDKLLQYYRIHLEGMGEIRSHLVLEQVFRK